MARRLPAPLGGLGGRLRGRPAMLAFAGLAAVRAPCRPPAARRGAARPTGRTASNRRWSRASPTSSPATPRSTRRAGPACTGLTQMLAVAHRPGAGRARRHRPGQGRARLLPADLLADRAGAAAALGEPRSARSTRSCATAAPSCSTPATRSPPAPGGPPSPEASLPAQDAGDPRGAGAGAGAPRPRADQGVLPRRQLSRAATPPARPGWRRCRRPPRVPSAARPAPATASARSSSPATTSPPPGRSGRRGEPLYPWSAATSASARWRSAGGVNIVIYTLTGNYKADQVHVPALLERLGQ